MKVNPKSSTAACKNNLQLVEEVKKSAGTDASLAAHCTLYQVSQYAVGGKERNADHEREMMKIESQKNDNDKK